MSSYTKLIAGLLLAVVAASYAAAQPYFRSRQDNSELFSRADLYKAIDDAMSASVPSSSGGYSLGGSGYLYNGFAMHYLTIQARRDPSIRDTSGNLVLDKAIDHIQAALTPGTHPLLTGGHNSWFDIGVPMSIAIARRTPEMWGELTAEQQTHADVLMTHVLYFANIYCNFNDQHANDISDVQVDMTTGASGTLPNQSAAAHMWGIASYVYWGGTAAMNAVLADYNSTTFHTTLDNEGFTDIGDLYEDADLLLLLGGTAITNADPDDQGVTKPFSQLNTRNHDGSTAGQEHPYNELYDPIDATPFNFYFRWGHEYQLGAQPKGNVGNDQASTCGGTSFGLQNGTLPYEGEGKGMPYEFNARGNSSAAPTRSSWDYVRWAMNHLQYMYASLHVLGYLDVSNATHREVIARTKKGVEIFRYVGANKWFSNAGPASEICTSDHANGNENAGGFEWAWQLMDELLYGEQPTYSPAI